MDPIKIIIKQVPAQLKDIIQVKNGLAALTGNDRLSYNSLKDTPASLTLDSTPTENSTNGVTSGGVFTALADKPSNTEMSDAISTAVAGLYDDRGNFDASGNVFPSTGGSGIVGAILKGDIWTISVAGTLGSTSVKQGDTIRALQDTPGQIEGNWAIVETGLTAAQLSALGLVTQPAALNLTTGSNAILLNNLVGQKYNLYNMTSGALTLTVGSHIDSGGAFGKIVADGSTLPDYSAFTLLDSVNGDYDNTNGVVNWWSAFWDDEDANAYLLWSKVQ